MSAAILRCSLGDCPVLSGSLLLPLRGNWCATVEVRAPNGLDPVVLDALSPVSLRLTREDGTVDIFEGTVRRSGVVEGRAVIHATIVGGAGQLLADVPPRHYAPAATEVPAGLIARGICDDAGEQLAGGVEAALDARVVRQWTRFAMPARDALDVLADVIGCGWRVLPSGRVWLGQETWPELDASKRIAPDPDDGAELWATDGAPILPGVTLVGRRIVEVTYRLEAVRPRATVRAAVAGDPPRAARLDLYRASYPATVRAQGTDVLDLEPDDPRLGDSTRALLSVPMRLGIPGCRVTVPAGTRLRVAFEGALPSGLYAGPVDHDPTADRALSLVGDRVDCGRLAGVADPVTGIVTFTYSSPDGSTPPPAPLVALSGVVSGPGHKYAKGVSG